MQLVERLCCQRRCRSRCDLCENWRRGSWTRGRRQTSSRRNGIEISGLDILIQKAYHFIRIERLTLYSWGTKKCVRGLAAAALISSAMCRESSTQTSSVDSSRARNSCICGSTGIRWYDGCERKRKVRQEGKEYVVQEGDVMLFRFNV